MSQSPLSCPACRKILSRNEETGLAVYRCVGCGGALVAVAVLRPRVPPEMFRALWAHIAAAGRTEDRRCPSCLQSLVAFPLATSAAALELDACRLCQLVWFDPGELDRLRPSLTTPPPRPALVATAPHAIEPIGGDGVAGWDPWDLWAVGDFLVDAVCTAIGSIHR